MPYPHSVQVQQVAVLEYHQGSVLSLQVELQKQGTIKDSHSLSINLPHLRQVVKMLQPVEKVFYHLNLLKFHINYELISFFVAQVLYHVNICD